MDNIEIKKRLDMLCEKGQKHLRLWSLARLWHVILNQSVTVSLILSSIVIGLSLGAMLLGWNIWLFGPWETAIFLLALTGGYILARGLWVFWFFKADRIVSLTFFDEHLSSGSRMVTADEFISSQPSTSFEQAAVEDVIAILEQGEQAELPKVSSRLASLSTALRGKIAGLFGLIILASWLQTPSFSELLSKETPSVMTAQADKNLLTDLDQEIFSRTASREGQILAEFTEKDEQSDQENAEETEKRQVGDEGKSSSTKAGKTQTTGQSSSSQGGAGSLSPSPDTNPQKAGAKKPEKSSKKADGKNIKQVAQTQNAQPKKTAKQKAQLSARQVASKEAKKKKADDDNQGSKISDKQDSPALTAKKTSDQTGAGKESRQKMTGDQQIRAPSATQRKKSSGSKLKANAETTKKSPPKKGGKGNKKGKSDQKKPANQGKGKAQKPSNKKPGGRPSQNKSKESKSGKQGGRGVDPIKKSRGVASLMLGVPLPDRIKGQARDGYIKKTQEKSDPKAEKAGMQNADERTARSGQTGPIAHPVMTPAMQRIVQKYFETIGKYSNESNEE